MDSKERGVFIVLEGLDRCGKTTQINLLEKYLLSKNIRCYLMKFPERSTEIGKMIDRYLLSNTDIEDHVIHLLFSANRWELSEKIEKMLSDGINIICDRYVYSGIAFSSSKQNLKYEWCYSSDIGLPEPDCVLFLDIPVEECSLRKNYGEERYEKIEFQKKVYYNFKKLDEKNNKIWFKVNAMDDIDSISKKICDISLSIIDKCKLSNIKYIN